MSARTALEQGLAASPFAVDAAARDRLLAYLDLIHKWNRVYNLTAVRNVEEMVAHHVLDSLAVLEHLPPGPLLDIGSGAGLPGVPIAIAQPDRSVTLLDSNHKKATFLRQAKIELGLDNVEVVCERAEAWQAHRPCQVVISRAYSELASFIAVAHRFCAPDGVMAAMKGVYPDEELAAVPASYEMSVRRIHVPGLSAERHLVLLHPSPVATTKA